VTPRRECASDSRAEAAWMADLMDIGAFLWTCSFEKIDNGGGQ
jgi:hypothetical protein